ncbi:MAG: MATE family efflux transporter, partial [Armatimonadetes bacterium]|nr:MATE family efflux transporter [Candidatus Hippobium faecium]
IEKTHVILYAIIILTITNIILDYVLIFGKFGFKEMGLEGAAYATITAYTLACLFLICNLFFGKYKEAYKVQIKIKFDYINFKKLIKYGVPSGIQVTVNSLIWTIFIMIIGKFSITQLVASNIVLQLDQIAVMPVIGVGSAASILIANELGKAEKKSLNMIVRTGVSISIIYNFIVCLLFIFIPEILILPFTDINNPDEKLIHITVNILKILALYVIFDGWGNILSSVLKGAGDTVFIMWTIFICGVIFIICPALTAIKINSLYCAWWGAFSYIIVICMIFMIRVKQGKWKKIKIIEG